MKELNRTTIETLEEKPTSRLAWGMKLGWILAIFSSVIYSANTPIARGAFLAGMNPLTLIMARFTMGTLLFGITLSVTSLSRAGEGQPKLGRSITLIALGSGLLNGLSMVLFYYALTRIEASLSSMIVIALYPIFTLLLLRWRGEQLTRRSVVRLTLGLIGLYFLLGPSGMLDWGGVVMATIGAMLFAVHMVSVQWYLRPYNTWATSALMVTGASIAAVALWLGNGADVFVPGPWGWLAILFQGVMATFIARLTTYASINILGSAQFALLSPLETLLTVVWSVIFLGERLAWAQWVGGIFIIGGTVLAAEALRWPKRLAKA
jgi:drug/metabolite transporter (DMT)-like permease